MPKLTYPAVGVGFGVPNQNPQIKPRLDIKLKTYENSYKTYDSYLDMVKIMIKKWQPIMIWDSGRKSESFSSQIPKNKVLLLKIGTKCLKL